MKQIVVVTTALLLAGTLATVGLSDNTPVDDSFVGNATSTVPVLESKPVISYEERVKDFNPSELIGIHKVDKYLFEVLEAVKTKEGIELYARVYKGREQVSFGDGSIDIERFVLINSPGTKDEILALLARNIPEVEKEGSRIQSGKKGQTTTIITTYSGTPANSVRIKDHADRTWQAQQFTTTVAGTVDSVKFFHRINDGTPTDGVTVQIWTDNGSDSPSAVISGVTENIAQASIVDGGNSWSSSEFTTVTFGSPPTVTDATKYWMVMTRAGATDGTNYNNMWSTDPSSYAGGVFKTGDATPAWTLFDVDMAWEITITSATTGNNGAILVPSF